MWQTLKHLLILAVFVTGFFMPVIWIALIVIFKSADDKNHVISKPRYFGVESVINHSSHKAKQDTSKE